MDITMPGTNKLASVGALWELPAASDGSSGAGFFFFLSCFLVA